jgi:hypothetical protein
VVVLPTPPFWFAMAMIRPALVGERRDAGTLVDSPLTSPCLVFPDPGRVRAFRSGEHTGGSAVRGDENPG